MQLVNIENGFSLIENDKVVFSHTIDNPAIFIGKGKEKMDIYRGNFDIEDYVIERYPLKNAKVDGNKVLLSAYNDVAEIELNVETKDNYAKVNIKATNDDVNRIWIRIQNFFYNELP